jgi:hypothetical protein
MAIMAALAYPEALAKTATGRGNKCFVSEPFSMVPSGRLAEARLIVKQVPALVEKHRWR